MFPVVVILPSIDLFYALRCYNKDITLWILTIIVLVCRVMYLYL